MCCKRRKYLIDRSGSARFVTSYFGYDPESTETSSYNLFQNENISESSVRKLLCETNIEHLQVLPASIALATLDRQLGAKSGMGLAVSNSIKAIADDFDYVLLDCPPMLGVLMVNALAACEHLIIPVQTEFLAIKGLERMLHTMKMIERSKNLQLPYTIVPTMYDRRTRASIDSLKLMQEQFGEYLWDSLIPVDTRFREASRVGKPLGHFLPASRGALAYRELFDFLLEGKKESEQRLAL